MADEYVTIATCSQSYEAEIIRGRLQAEGIEVQIPTGGWASVYLGDAGNVFGGVKVRVPETDAERAKTLLGEHIDFSDVGYESVAQCPECGSDDVSASPPSSGLLAVMRGLLPSKDDIALQAYCCAKCGRHWTE